jgi:hypothetical protein
MQKFFIIPMVVMLSGLSPVLARGGHGGGMHGSGMGMQSGMGMNGGLQSSGGFGPNARGGLSAPAEPTVPPSLTPDSRLATGAPLPPHQQPTRAQAALHDQEILKPTPEEAAVDRAIGNICKGC